MLPEPGDYAEKVAAVLTRGVDGIMTDRPQRVRAIIDEWSAQNM